MPGEFFVRLAKPSDLDRILQVERQAFGEWAYERRLFAAYLRKSGEYFLVAVRSGEVCGYIVSRAIPHRVPSAELVSIAVDREVRGVGAASALMDSTLRRLARKRIGRFILMVKVSNRRARKFYERYGFEKTRLVRGYYEDDRDGVLMERMAAGEQEQAGRPVPRCTKR